VTDLPSPPVGTTEVGIDIIKVDRIRAAIAKHGRRFAKRVLTEHEDAYVRDRAENFAGRWAAKEAVSKVLGLGVRGVGWREIEIIRLPTGAPMCRLHDRALRRANQLGMARVAVSISHEREYAVAIAFGVRTKGGEFIFPVDMEARMDDRERQLMARLRELRDLDAEVRMAEVEARAGTAEAMPGTEAEPEAGAEPEARAGRSE
jgi:holo-[acyl-carrier protein] synthase